MSRIGKLPITIPAGVTVKIDGNTVAISGEKGEMARTIPAGITVKQEGAALIVERDSDEKQTRALHGTTRSLQANMVEGVSKGFQKDLEISGVGFRAALQGRTLVMNVGFSHPIEYDIPEGITVNLPDQTSVSITGCSKELVGQVGARLRAFCPAEPYKGKGIKYKGERIRRKAGKAVA